MYLRESALRLPGDACLAVCGCDVGAALELGAGGVEGVEGEPQAIRLFLEFHPNMTYATFQEVFRQISFAQLDIQ